MKKLSKTIKLLFLVAPILWLMGCGSGNDAILKMAAKEVNKDCPTRVDDITVLKEVTYVNGVFTYVYELDPDMDSEAIMTADDDLVREVLSEMVREKAVSNPNVKEFYNTLQKNGSKLVYHYIIKDGSGRTRDVELDYY